MIIMENLVSHFLRFRGRKIYSFKAIERNRDMGLVFPISSVVLRSVPNALLVSCFRTVSHVSEANRQAFLRLRSRSTIL